MYLGWLREKEKCNWVVIILREGKVV